MKSIKRQCEVNGESMRSQCEVIVKSIQSQCEVTARSMSIRSQCDVNVNKKAMRSQYEINAKSMRNQTRIYGYNTDIDDIEFYLEEIYFIGLNLAIVPSVTSQTSRGTRHGSSNLCVCPYNYRGSH